MGITNETMKLVFNLPKDHVSVKLWKEVITNSGTVFHDWRVEHYIADHVVHSMKPILKPTAAGVNFLEQVCLVQKSKSESIQKLSGQKGIFIRPFKTLQESEEEAGPWKMIWFSQNITYDQAWTLSKRLGNHAARLAFRAGGLGVRVPTDNFVECGKMKHGDAFQVPGTRKVDQISNISIWVDRLQETLRTEIKWTATFIRSMGPWMCSRKCSFILNHTDVLWIGVSLAPIQQQERYQKMKSFFEFSMAGLRNKENWMPRKVNEEKEKQTKWIYSNSEKMLTEKGWTKENRRKSISRYRDYQTLVQVKRIKDRGFRDFRECALVKLRTQDHS